LKSDHSGATYKDFQRITCEAASDRTAIAKLADKAADTIKKMALGIDFDLFKLVLLEALGNALLYGNLEISSEIRDIQGEDHFWKLVGRKEQDQRYRSKKIALILEHRHGILRCTIKDQGRGFDWKLYMGQMSQATNDKFHGRGIFLIKNYTDDLSWNDEGNEVTFSINTLEGKTTA